MKYFYITTPQDFINGARHFATAHYIDLPNGNILLAGEHRTTEDKKIWESRNTQISLPHPLSGKQVGTDLAAQLQSLGIKPEHTIWDVSELVSKIHAGLSLDAE